VEGVEHGIVAPDGTTRWLSVNAAPLFDEKGQMHGAVASFRDITERKRVEESLRVKDRAIESSISALAITDLAGHLTYVNPAFIKLWGYDDECEVLGRSALALWQREDEAAAVVQALMTQGRWIGELTGRGKDGNPIDLQVIASMVVDGAGQPSYMLASFEDITERRRAEEALAREEAQLRATLYSIGDAVIATDIEGRVARMNPVAEQLTGWSEAGAVGRPLDEVFCPVDEETGCQIQDPVRQILQEGIAGETAGDILLIARGGRETPIAVDSAPILDQRGMPTGVVLVFRDQTEEHLNRHLTQARLSLIKYAADHSLDEFLTRALDKVSAFVGSPIGFYHFVEPDQKTLSLQQWSTRTLNEFCQAEGRGLHYGVDEAGVWVDCVHGKRAVIHNDYEALPHKKGLPEGHAHVSRELVVPVMREGKVVAILGVGNKPCDYVQKDVEIVSYLADVTWEIVRQKRAEEALQESARELAHSNRELEQFAYAISHDLQEPLRMVSGFLGLLDQQSGEQLDDRSREFLDHALDGAMRMQAMIQGLLDLARVTTQGHEFAPVDCEAVLEHTLQVMQVPLAASASSVTYDPLPTVLADEVQVGQVLQNLIGNAVKFRRQDQPRIHVSAEPQGDHWRFSVQDNGIGLDPAQTERIFGVFQRLHAHGEYQGMGMGLAICKKIVERHGGRIWVESEPGMGATFFFTLPSPAVVAPASDGEDR
jgi:PAS domain S-box-containing protein